MKLKTLALVLFLSTPAWATLSTSWFAYTPNCCNRAAIRTDVFNDSGTQIIGTRFEYFRRKNDGTCQHVKHVSKMAHLFGYVHFDTRSEPEGYFENTMNACCGTAQNPWSWVNCQIQVFTGPEPQGLGWFGLEYGGTMGIPASVP